MAPIPISLVAGFLGSGKTSLLRHWLARRPAERRWVCLVNEFGPVDVDGGRLMGRGAEVLPIPGGSIFCQCLVTEFMGALRRLEEWHRQAPVDGVLIEASGVADPRAVQRLLQETGREREFAVRTIVTVVDPGSFAKLRHTLPNLKAQIEAADHLVINKVDCHPVERVEATGEDLRALNARAAIHHASFGRVGLDPFAREERWVAGGGELACGPDSRFAVCQIRHQGEVDEARFREGIRAVRAGLYRVKGHLRLDGRLCSVDYADAGLILGEPDRAGVESQLVVIFAPEHEEVVRRGLLRPLGRGEWDKGG